MIGTRPTIMPAFLYIHTMAVVLPDPTTGAYTDRVLTAQPCRLCETSRKQGANAPLRQDSPEARVLLFPPDLDTILPNSQIWINFPFGNGMTHYQIVNGSDQAARGPSGELVYRSVEVVRAIDPGDTADL